MRTGDILLLALIGVGVYLVFRPNALTTLFPSMVSVPRTAPPSGYFFLGPRCPPGQFIVHSGPLGMGPGYCSSTIPTVLS